MTIFAHAKDCTCTDCTNHYDDGTAVNTPNYDQPHLVVHQSQRVFEREHRRTSVTAFLCVYQLRRCYGGSEEGGWWYDAWDFIGAAFPFQAEQEFEVQVLDEESDDCSNAWFCEDRKAYCQWVPVGLPHVTDEATRVRLQSTWQHFESMYGAVDTDHRFSVRPKEDDHRFIYELDPGARGNQPRPRYC